jgi:hypothetical protein
MRGSVGKKFLPTEKSEHLFLKQRKALIETHVFSQSLQPDPFTRLTNTQKIFAC